MWRVKYFIKNTLDKIFCLFGWHEWLDHEYEIWEYCAWCYKERVKRS